MTGWEHEERLTALWGLQSFTVAYVHFEPRDDLGGRSRTVKVIGLADRRDHHVCPDCGQHHAWGIVQELEPRRWRDCSVGDVVTYVEVCPWRVACCGGTRVECFPWEAQGHRMTRRFFERIAGLCTRLPISEVARMAHLSWDTVARVDAAAITLALGDPQELLNNLRWIGIDEVSRTGGHVYFTIVTDLISGRVVWIGDGKGRAGLAPFFETLGKKRCRKIKGVLSDLGFVAVIQHYVPQALFVLDRFHIVKWLNEALNQVRRRVFGGAPRDEVGGTLKAKKWMLLSARENLDGRYKQLLATLMTTHRVLFRAYLLKEQLRGLLHYAWQYFGALRRNLLEWCRAAGRSRIAEMKTVAKRLRPHLEKVVAGFKARVPLGLVEAINGKIVQLRRQARGFRDKDYYKLKIFQRCSIPGNPWAAVTL